MRLRSCKSFLPPPKSKFLSQVYPLAVTPRANIPLLTGPSFSNPIHPLHDPKLLKIIFSHLLNGPVDPLSLIPLRLSQVSKSWRTYLISSKIYWSSITLNCSQIGFTGILPTSFLWAKTLLARSSPLPISLRLLVDRGSRASLVKDLLYKHLPGIPRRVTKLVINADTTVAPNDVWSQLDLVPFMTNKLNAFEYKSADGSSIIASRKPSRLRQPLAPGYLSGFTSLSINYLTLHPVSSADRLSRADLGILLAQNALTLEHLEIVDDSPLICKVGYPWKVQLRKLKSLSIGYRTPSVSADLLDALDLPILHTVTLRDIARAPHPTVPPHYWDVNAVAVDLGGTELISSFAKFPTIRSMRFFGVRCAEPCHVFDYLELGDIVFVNSDDVFRNLICSVFHPGWGDSCCELLAQPLLTISGLCIQQLTLAGEAPDLLELFLKKRLGSFKEGYCAPLEKLRFSARCLHRALVGGTVEESLLDSFRVDVRRRLMLVNDAVLSLGGELTLIKQPEEGRVYRLDTPGQNISEDIGGSSTTTLPGQSLFDPLLPTAIPDKEKMTVEEQRNVWYDEDGNQV